MAENSGGNGFLGFIVGALVVVVLALGFFVVQGGNFGGNSKSIDLKVEAPKVATPS